MPPLVTFAGRPTPDELVARQVRLFVNEVLCWDLTVARVERQQRGDRSSLAGVLVVLETGVYGSGCAGTKGVGRLPTPEPEAVRADPVGTARYQALTGQARRVVDAICADGRGECLAEVRSGRRCVEANLAARIGLALSPEDQRARWLAAIAQGDSRPALAGAEALGLTLLVGAAQAWWDAPDGSP